jgi:hypothetical protein
MWAGRATVSTGSSLAGLHVGGLAVFSFQLVTVIHTGTGSESIDSKTTKYRQSIWLAVTAVRGCGKPTLFRLKNVEPLFSVHVTFTK